MTEAISESPYRSPDQPTLIYNIHDTWAENVRKGPDWRAQEFPPLPQEANYEFLGLRLISPIVIAAGPSAGKRYSDFYLKMGYGIVTEKTKRTVPKESNSAPNIAVVKTLEQITRENLATPLQGTMDEGEYVIYLAGTNSFGNPSPTIKEWSTELRSQLESVSKGQILACSVTATIPEEPVSNPTEYAINDLLIGITAAASSGVSVVELNLACPNVTEHPEEGEMFLDPFLIKTVMQRARLLFPEIKVGFKAGLFQSKEQMRRVLAESGADFISLINALSVPVVDGNGDDMLFGRRKAGLCGKPLKDIALEHVMWASEIRKDEGLGFGIIGGGGVTSVSDIDQFRNSGADLVFSGSYVLHNPLLAYEYAVYAGT